MSSVLDDDISVMSVGELAVRDARQLLGIADYEYKSEYCHPPKKVNCSILVWWVFSRCGIEMPRISSRLFHDLLYFGKPVDMDDLAKGHLIFTAGRRSKCRDDDRAKDGVGHVGIVSGDGLVIHASYLQKTVVEESMRSFLNGANHFRGCFSVH